MKPLYDQIGRSYSKHRCADRRILEQLIEVLQLSLPATIADIGAGTGNYSRGLADRGFHVEAVEPSSAMRRQAVPHPAVRWSTGTAEHLPLPDNCVDAVVSVLAVHHFSSIPSAAAEMVRVCAQGPIVWLTFDPRQAETPWLADYFPAIWTDTFSAFPAINDICAQLASITGRDVKAVPCLIPCDLEDCFLAAGWRRPQMYLDPQVRACMSAFALADADVVNQGVQELTCDLQSTKWQAKYADLLKQDFVDWGYRFLRAE